MCYNCGCGMPEDDMGQGHAGAEPQGKAITTKTFEAAAAAFGGSADEAKRRAFDLLQEEMKDLEEKKE